MKVFKTVLGFAILCLSATAVGQPTEEIWYGVLEIGPQNLRLEINVERDSEGVYQGALKSLDQGNVEVPLSRFEFKDGRLNFEIKQLGASFDGKLEGGTGGEKVAVGKFNQGGAVFDMAFERVTKIPVPTMIRTWQGTLVTESAEYEFQIRMFRDQDGGLSARLDSFNERMMGLPIELGPTTTSESEAFQFQLKASQAAYDGRRTEDGRFIEGKWKQAGTDFPLNFKEVPIADTRLTLQRRPQTPEGPFQYEASDHRIKSNRSPGVELGATLTHPKGDGPYPAVILISGSGQQDRDETILGHKSFFVIADHFAKNGIATLRFDDRGKAESTGDPTQCTSEDFADDVETLVDWLKHKQVIDSDNIILVGHSEGGYIGPMIAARRPKIAAVVMLAGTTVPGTDIVLDQSRRIAAAAGADHASLAAQDILLKNLFAMLANGQAESPDFVGRLLAKTRNDLPDLADEAFDLSVTASDRLGQMNSPWFRFFLKYDPAVALKKMDQPVLALFGEHDLQVHPDLNAPVLEEIWKSGKHPISEMVRFPQLNHLFQTSKTGAPSEYGQIEETFNGNVLDKMTIWIQAVAAGNKRISE